MSVYVMRNGKLIAKRDAPQTQSSRSTYPCPMISRIEAFESPITGKEITSWRDRDRDMDAAGAVDPRDLPRKPFEQRKKKRHERSIIEAAADHS
jgi:hypothetical protein